VTGCGKKLLRLGLTYVGHRGYRLAPGVFLSRGLRVFELTCAVTASFLDIVAFRQRAEFSTPRRVVAAADSK